MKMVYTHIEYTHVGHFQSVLEDEGIQTTVKNRGSSIGMGEIPFVEVWPELWVLNNEDAERASTILEEINTASETKTPAWTCPKCKTEVEEGFSECWNCSEVKAH